MDRDKLKKRAGSAVLGLNDHDRARLKAFVLHQLKHRGLRYGPGWFSTLSDEHALFATLMIEAAARMIYYGGPSPKGHKERFRVPAGRRVL